MSEIITSIFFIFAVIDPIGSIPVYLEATKEFDLRHKKKIAIRASVIAFLILLFFIVIGQLILEGMSVSLNAFQISGGVILFLFALTMIFGDGKPEEEKSKITDYKHVTIFPIAIPSIASPGAIMAVVLMTDNHIYSIQEQFIATALVLFVIGLTCLILLGANKLQERIGNYGITVISKIMGLILAAYAVQSILSGISSYFGTATA
ncbi:MarC family protein [Dokdonia sp. 4H-3-7-5]|mgnify:CR=1 FL=1|jgi:multiple antibiotic resistance protein|uniref:MarC family protein n=1 Tax=Dokdonia sp. (strain 4H-3-7-5) TaxID=983548 RepID=UPI00020A7512|nr:MarC family protein [Dokdonia sp. 4H-3-7-5]AEE19790.1 multiple antibiotic resistance (MarC)-related protein [Dokdonia sp. 4H-3-7-5]|tara:strand:+ start:31949 stop:32566 length:618 start_codon:yes stop_codon:yes gene_type:complete